MIALKDVRGRARSGTLLQTLTETQAETVFQSARHIRFKKGEVIYRQGDSGESAALITSGAVKISSVSATGREIVYAYLSVGDMVGDLAVLDGSERTATASAAETTECLVISRADFMRMLESEPSLAQAVIRFLCGRLRATNSLLESDRSYEQAARLARGILRLLKEHGGQSDQVGQVDLAVSQSDLGAFVSMARENVSRQISDWTRAGVLKVKGGRITVVDKEALEEIGDVFD